MKFHLPPKSQKLAYLHTQSKTIVQHKHEGLGEKNTENRPAKGDKRDQKPQDTKRRSCEEQYYLQVQTKQKHLASSLRVHG